MSNKSRKKKRTKSARKADSKATGSTKESFRSTVPKSFSAFRIFDDEDGYRAELVDQSIDDQTEGDVVIKVAYSSINYKDALAGTGKGKILRRFPLNGGIDAAGTVVDQFGFRSFQSRRGRPDHRLRPLRDPRRRLQPSTFGSPPNG
jgi:hypothetical protein